jgi:ferredoxin, 2Fe-2S
MQTVHVHITDYDGTRHTLEGIAGWRLMEVIRDYGLPIKAECGGACACATCHVYVDEKFAGLVGKPSAMEQSMLDFAENVKPNSRLSCQIKIKDELDGLRVTTPESQH